MGQLGADIAQVTVESAWWSRVNWAQIVGWICSGLALFTAGKFNVSAEIQGLLVLLIQGITGLLTVWFRHTTTTITPAAARMLKQQQ
jgi:hypothetical protein